jgi:hypothetical protein
VRRVLIEVGHQAEADRIRRYEFTAFKDAIARGESPALFSLAHALTHDQAVPQNWHMATEHVVHWLGAIDGVVLYIDLGMSPRMIAIRDAAVKQNVPLELRTIEFQACQ